MKIKTLFILIIGVLFSLGLTETCSASEQTEIDIVNQRALSAKMRWEQAKILAATDPYRDTDGDGLTDEFEWIFGTSLDNPDTDGDGYSDFEEIDNAYDPLTTSTEKFPRRIEIDLKNQRLFFFVNGVRWREFPVSTGKASMPTPRGDFQIRNKVPKAWSRDYGLWMPYWMGVVGGVGIHQLPIWPNGYREGTDHLGRPVSHGCIRLGIIPAAYLYDRTSVGTPVKIY